MGGHGITIWKREVMRDFKCKDNKEESMGINVKLVIIEDNGCID